MNQHRSTRPDGPGSGPPTPGVWMNEVRKPRLDGPTTQTEMVLPEASLG